MRQQCRLTAGCYWERTLVPSTLINSGGWLPRGKMAAVLTYTSHWTAHLRRYLVSYFHRTALPTPAKEKGNYISMDAWKRKLWCHRPPTSWGTLELRCVVVLFIYFVFFYYFCSFTAPLINWNTNCTWLDARRLDALHFFCGEPVPHSGLEYILQRFDSSMRFSNESVFTEIFLKSIKGKLRGKDCFCLCGGA